MKNLHAPTCLKIMERFSTLTGCEQPAARAAPAKLLGELQADVMALARPEVALDKRAASGARPGPGRKRRVRVP